MIRDILILLFTKSVSLVECALFAIIAVLFLIDYYKLGLIVIIIGAIIVALIETLLGI